MDVSLIKRAMRRPRRWFDFWYAVIGRLAGGGTDRAAAMAYYAVQALFPGLLVVALISVLLSNPESITNAVDSLQRQGLDPDIAQTLKTILGTATDRIRGTVGFALAIAGATALLSASGWLAAAGRAIEPESERRKSRDPVTGKLRAAMWTIVLLTLLVLALIGITTGGDIADKLFDWIGYEEGAPTAWSILRPILTLGGIILAMLLLYRVAPDRINSPPFRHLLPGALLAGIGWVAATVGFAFYIGNIAKIGATYGTFATPIIVLLWLWLSGVVVLLGAEFNAELTHRRNGYVGPTQLEGADDERISGHPVGALPEREKSEDDERDGIAGAVDSLRRRITDRE